MKNEMQSGGGNEPLSHDGVTTTDANFNTTPHDASDTGRSEEHTDPEPETETHESEQEGSEEIEATGYEPNLKFKVMDEEHEFDPFLRDVITDADTEKKVRELYEKAYGLDHVKPKFQQTKEEYKNLKQEYDGFMSEVSDLRDDYKNRDFDSFFKKLAIPKEDILKWVYEEARYQELPPEQRQAYDAKRQAEQQARQLGKQNQQLQEYYTQQVTQAKAYALNTALEQPSMRQIVQQFDARAGRPGAFRDEVINRGEFAWFQRKEDIPPEQAIQEVLTLAGMTPGSVQQPLQSHGAGSAGNGYNQQPQQQAPKRRPPSIPNLDGREIGRAHV